LQEMIRNGILFQGYFAISYSHKDAEIKKTLSAFEKALVVYANALTASNREQYLIGEVCKPVFRKYN
jgi:hypothetical protein